jgi:NADPH2:quinone reductase
MSSAAVFDRLLAGEVKVSIGQRYPLAEVARAHTDLESRLTTGSTLLLP